MVAWNSSILVYGFSQTRSIKVTIFEGLIITSNYKVFFFFSRHSDIYHLIFCFQTTLKFDRKVLLPPKQLHQSQLELHLSLSCFLLMLPTYLCFISCINSYLQISTACFRKLKMLKSLSRSLHVVCVYTEDRLKRWKA